MSTKDLKLNIKEINSNIEPVPPVRLENIFGNIRVITDTSAGDDLVPTAVPSRYQNQLVIYRNTTSGTYRLYIYDKSINWAYVDLTAT